MASSERIESSVSGGFDALPPNTSPKKRVIAVGNEALVGGTETFVGGSETLSRGGVRFSGSGVDEGGIVAVDMAAGGKPLRSRRSTTGGASGWARKSLLRGEGGVGGGGIGQPSVYHALVVIFLEFFAWGLLTNPMITVLAQTFPNHTFLMNGLINGIKGILSFLSAPLIGALSDIWGRKTFLFITVFFTCAPIPLLRISPWWCFAVISMSGCFAVTFSVVFAYVADVTTQDERSAAYGLVSGTFAASLVTSPAIGAYLQHTYSDSFVILLATLIAFLDVLFIIICVPESLPEKMRISKQQATVFTWETADPFSSLRRMGHDFTIIILCATVFLSYLPEAGQYSSFFVYLRLVIGFSEKETALFIGVVGLLSVIAQTVGLTLLMKTVGNKNTIIIGLVCEMIQLAWYGLGSQNWMMWAAGVVAAASSINYPAISAFVSNQAEANQQGVVQGMVTGIRGLCNGLGPALYGCIFYLFHVDLNIPLADLDKDQMIHPNATVSAPHIPSPMRSVIPGPPFVFGSVLVILALLVALFIPESPKNYASPSGSRKNSKDVERATEKDSPSVLVPVPGSIAYKVGASGSRTISSTGIAAPSSTGMLSGELMSGAVSADGSSSSEAEPTATLLVKIKN